MHRQDQRCIVGNPQIVARYGDTLLGKPADFGKQGMRVEHHAIADDGKLAGPHDARRQQAQLVSNTVDDEGMAGIVAALEPHNDIGSLRQPVDDLTLALVTPLRADDNHIGHLTMRLLFNATNPGSVTGVFKLIAPPAKGRKTFRIRLPFKTPMA